MSGLKFKGQASAISAMRFYYSAAGLLACGCFIALRGLAPQLSLLANYLASVTLAAFFITGFDKRIAGTGALRVPEMVLYGVAAMGGSIGVLVGAQVFRHKIRKPKFLLIILLILAVQTGILSYTGASMRGILMMQQERSDEIGNRIPR